MLAIYTSFVCRTSVQIADEFCRHSADILQIFCRQSADRLQNVCTNCRSVLQTFCRHFADILQTISRSSAERLYKLQISSADILQTFCRYSADILQIICRLSADLLQMFQQICCRLKTDLLVSYGRASPQTFQLPKSCPCKPFPSFEIPTTRCHHGARYLKSCTWLIVLSYTSIGGCGQQLIVIYSVLGALMTSPRSAAAYWQFWLAGTEHGRWRTQARRCHPQSPSHFICIYMYLPASFR